MHGKSKLRNEAMCAILKQNGRDDTEKGNRDDSQNGRDDTQNGRNRDDAEMDGSADGLESNANGNRPNVNMQQERERENSAHEPESRKRKSSPFRRVRSDAVDIPTALRNNSFEAKVR